LNLTSGHFARAAHPCPEAYLLACLRTLLHQLFFFCLFFFLFSLFLLP
jgi:hypothetical protein